MGAMGDPRCSPIDAAKHESIMLTLENKRLLRQLEIQREITREWERRFDLLLKLVPAIKHEPAPAVPASQGWWVRHFGRGR